MRSARSIADSYITLFQNARIQYVSEQQTGEIVSEVITKEPDGFESLDDTVKIIDRFQESMEARASADLAGRGTFRTWKYRHPNGHDICGVVRVWTPENLKQTQAVRNWKPDNRIRKSSDQDEAGRDYESGVEESRNVMDIHDF